MQSIIAKYIGPGNVRGSRIIVKATGGIRRSYKLAVELSNDENLKACAQKFAQELGWSGEWIGGAYDNKGALIFVRQWHDRRDNFKVSPAQIIATQKKG